MSVNCATLTGGVLQILKPTPLKLTVIGIACLAAAALCSSYILLGIGIGLMISPLIYRGLQKVNSYFQSQKINHDLDELVAHVHDQVAYLHDQMVARDPWSEHREIAQHDGIYYIRKTSNQLMQLTREHEETNHADVIVGNLALGCLYEFATTFSRPFTAHNIGDLDYNNTHNYDSVITCTSVTVPSQDLKCKKGVHFSLGGDDAPALLHPQDLVLPNWFHIGETAYEPKLLKIDYYNEVVDVEEARSYWNAMVMGAQNPLHLPAAQDGVVRGFPEATDETCLNQTLRPLTNKRLQQHIETANREIEGLQVSEYFKEIFEVMDTAVFGDKKVLVHCQKGRSRSAAIVAAYLINRFGMTVQQAMNKIWSSRPSAAPKLIHQLHLYAEALRAQ